MSELSESSNGFSDRNAVDVKFCSVSSVREISSTSLVTGFSTWIATAFVVAVWRFAAGGIFGLNWSDAEPSECEAFGVNVDVIVAVVAVVIVAVLVNDSTLFVSAFGLFSLANFSTDATSFLDALK